MADSGETGNLERKARKEAQRRAKAESISAKKSSAAAAAAAAGGSAAEGSGGKTLHRLDPRSQPASVQLSKALSYILRHGAVKEGLVMGVDGFVPLREVLARPRVRSVNMGGEEGTGARKPNLDDVRQIVAQNDKQRFELVQRPTDDDDEEWWIRAVQGHSLAHVTAVQHTQLHPDNLHLITTSPAGAGDGDGGNPVVIHGTTAAAWTVILDSGGLSPMTRNHIHLARAKWDEDDSVISGMRRSSTRLIYIDLRRALADGIPFFLSSNGVILTPGQHDTRTLPVHYFTHVHDQHGNTIWQQP